MKYVIAIIFISVGLYLGTLSLMHFSINLYKLINSKIGNRKIEIKTHHSNDLSKIEFIKSRLKRMFNVKLNHYRLVNYLKKASFTEQFIYMNFAMVIISLYSMIILKDIKGILNFLIVLFLTGVCLICLFLINYDKERKNVFNSIMYTVCTGVVLFIIGIASIYILYLFSENYIRLRAIACCLIFYWTFAGFCFIKCTDYYVHKFFMILITLLIYFVMIGFGSFIFGMYYHELFKINTDEIKRLLGNGDFIKPGMQFIKVGIKNFYEYPDGKYLCKVSIAQYLIGKMLDLFTLGYIFHKATQKESPKQENLVTHEANLSSIGEVASTKTFEIEVNSTKLNKNNKKRKKRKK